MDKHKKQLIITAGLILVMVVAWANTFKLIANRKKTKKAPVAISAPAAASDSNKAPSAPIKKPVIIQRVEDEEDLSWGRCPFSGKVYYGESKALDLKLSGVLWDQDNPQAIINGEILEVGQRIGKFTIIEIHSEGVIISDGTSKFELKIY